MSRFILLLIAPLLLSVSTRHEEPLPQELRTEPLLVLYYDMLPMDMSRDKAALEEVEELNKKRQKWNEDIDEALKDYPYPHVTAPRLEYNGTRERLPAHRYVLNSVLMEAANTGAMYLPPGASWREVQKGVRVMVADVHITDAKTGQNYVLSKDSDSRDHIKNMKGMLKEIVKRLEKGK